MRIPCASQEGERCRQGISSTSRLPSPSCQKKNVQMSVWRDTVASTVDPPRCPVAGAPRSSIGRSEMSAACHCANIFRPCQTATRSSASGAKISMAGAAISAGIALVPEDRKLHGLVLPMSVRENTSLASLQRDQKTGLLNFDAEEVVYSKMLTQ